MKTVKFLAMIVAVTMFGFACSSSDDDNKNPNPDPGPGSGTLTLTISPEVIQANGEDAATLEVRYDGELVTEGVEVYDGKTNKLLDLPSLRFTTTTPGTYSFWVAYNAENSGKATVTAIEQAVPERVADPAPANTDFKRRELLIQFTGTGCGYCPFMINLLRSSLAKEEYSSIVLAAAHRYNNDDPAYLSSAALEQAMGVSGYPMVVVDMHTSYKNYNSLSGLENMLSSAIGRTDAKAGISVNSELSGNTLVVRATVKAAATGEYRVGAWLLEDGINAKQSNYGAQDTSGLGYDTHDNCIRIADSRVSSTNYTGISVGSVNAGEIGEHVFVMTLNDKWVKANCRLVVFVSAYEGKGFYVNNVVEAAIGEQVAYDYK